MPVYYCQPSDIRSSVGGTDAGTGTCAQLSDGQLNEAIARAGAKVSSYAGTTWAVDASNPVVTVPDLISSLTLAIATFYATLTYRKGKDLSAMDPVYLGYVDAMATLKDIASGLIQVAPTAPADPVSDSARVINKLPSIFTYEDSGVLPNGRGGIQPAGAAGSRLLDGWR